MLQKSKKCLVCGTTKGLECHHVFYGSRRAAADRYGLTVNLCREHHTGGTGVHNNVPLDRRLKAVAQERFEKLYSHEEFMRIFGKDYHGQIDAELCQTAEDETG